MNIKDALDRYITFLKVRRLVRQTIEAYERILCVFFDQMKIISTFDLDLRIIEKYQEKLVSRLTGRTAREYSIVIRGFCQYLKDEEIINLKIHRIMIPKVIEKPVNYLERSEIDTVLEEISKNDGIQGMRDHAFFTALFDSGCRISELINLDRNSIVFEHKQAQVVGKGGKVRTVFFTETSIQLIKTYLRNRTDNYHSLFISHSNRNFGDRISKYQLQKSLKRIKYKLKIEKKDESSRS